jgi:photosystem II stability/assembly factor-like uncharacterized protein
MTLIRRMVSWALAGMAFCISHTSLAQGNWQQILPPGPTSNQLSALYFADSTTGWAVGEYGTVVKSQDGGKSWRLIKIPWQNTLADVHFPTPTAGFIVGENGLILKSVDGGESWTRKDIRFTNNLRRVLFRNRDNGWAIGEKGLILHTDDGGESWQQQFSNSSAELKGIALINDSTLCVTGKNKLLLLTRDQGRSWQAIAPAKLSTSYTYHFNDVYFLDNMTGWIGGQKIISDYLATALLLTTKDGGSSWLERKVFSCSYRDSTTRLSNNAYSLEQIHFTDPANGLMLQTAGSVELSSGQKIANGPFSTNDSGANWQCRLPGNRELMDHDGRFFFITPEKVIKIGYRGEFMISSNGGRSWIFTNATCRGFNGMRFGENGKILATRGYTGETADGWVNLSSDAGRTWATFDPVVFDANGSQIMPKFHARLGFDIGGKLWEYFWLPLTKKYSLFESADWGRTWRELFGPISIFPPSQLHYLTPDTVISYTFDLKSAESAQNVYLIFYSSTDGGRTFAKSEIAGVWNQLSPFDAENPLMNNHFFLNSRIGFIVGSDGNILRTMDAGQNWKNLLSGVADDLWDVCFLSEQVGFVVGEFGRILKTENGGESWRKTATGTQEVIYCISFKNDREGWAGTESGLLYTKDGGESWQAVPLRYQHGPIRYIHFDQHGNGLATLHYYYEEEEGPGTRMLNPQSPPWDYEYLLYWPAEGSRVTAPERCSRPASPQLAQNYPNPFNSITRIAYILPFDGEVRLTIYNLAGQKVRTLLHEHQIAGQHLAHWDGCTGQGIPAPSGVYICRLETSSDIKIRRIIYLR